MNSITTKIEEEGEEDFNIEQIVIALENIEKKNLKDDQTIIDWLEKITHPDFKFVDTLVDLILSDLTDHKVIQIIFKIFLKFLYYQREATLYQLQDNAFILKTLISYVLDNDMKMLSGEPFMLIVEICSKCDYKTVK